jgi:hypothetical protein
MPASCRSARFELPSEHALIDIASSLDLPHTQNLIETGSGCPRKCSRVLVSICCTRRERLQDDDGQGQWNQVPRVPQMLTLQHKR